MSPRDKQVRESWGKRGGVARGPVWFIVASWGLFTACADTITSGTTNNSLVPEELASTQPGHAEDAGEASSGTAAPASSSTADSAEATEGTAGVTAWASDEASASTTAVISEVTSEVTDAGPSDSNSVDDVDGSFSSLSPQTEPTCGIATSSGPPLCDPVANCGCGESQTCAYTPERVRLFTCIGPGAVAPGDACDADDACTSGHVCVAGLCAATCRYDEDCAEGSCGSIRSGETLVPNIRVCTSSCDPLVVGSCGSGATCANAPGSSLFACARQGASYGENQACGDSRDCAPGLGCAPDAVCRSWCPVESAPSVADAGGAESPSSGEIPTACPEFSQCTPFSVSAGVGLCGATCPVPEVEGSECSVFAPSCGCSGTETCQVEASGRTVCNPPGKQTAMGWCNSNADCGAGLSCVGALCRPVCDAEMAPCSDGSSCVKASTAPDAPSACLGHCDPVEPTLDDDEFAPCGVGAYCAPGFTTANPSLPESHCTRQNDRTVKDDAACDFDYDCKNGSGCDPQTRTCRPWCRGTEDCSSGACDLALSTPRTGAQNDAIGFCRVTP